MKVSQVNTGKPALKGSVTGTISQLVANHSRKAKMALAMILATGMLAACTPDKAPAGDAVVTDASTTAFQATTPATAAPSTSAPTATKPVTTTNATTKPEVTTNPNVICSAERAPDKAVCPMCPEGEQMDEANRVAREAMQQLIESIAMYCESQGCSPEEAQKHMNDAVQSFTSMTGAGAWVEGGMENWLLYSQTYVTSIWNTVFNQYLADTGKSPGA
jgi:hypothetical protein